MYKVITDINKINLRDWESFVLKHPFGNIFHTPEMVQLYSNSENHEPLVVACLNENNLIEGILVGDLQFETHGIIKIFSARTIVWGGPLVNNSNLSATKLLLTSFLDISKRKSVYCQFRNLWDTNILKNLFLNLGLGFEEHLDIHVDISQNLETIWNNIHPTRRKQINRGYKRGVKIQIKSELEFNEILCCYKILSSVYKKAQLPFPSIAFFQNAFKIFSNNKSLISALAYYNNQIIGFRFVLCYKHTIYDWYAGSNEKYYDKYPNDILPWEIMKWGHEKGYTVFDFGGAGKPNISYGVRDYKMKFGGQIVNFGRFEKIHLPLIYYVSKIGFYFWRKIKL